MKHQLFTCKYNRPNLSIFPHTRIVLTNKRGERLCYAIFRGIRMGKFTIDSITKPIKLSATAFCNIMFLQKCFYFSSFLVLCCTTRELGSRKFIFTNNYVFIWSGVCKLVNLPASFIKKRIESTLKSGLYQVKSLLTKKGDHYKGFRHV